MTWGGLRKPFKRNKYNAVKTGDGFPSKLEASLYGLLQLRVQNGELRDIERQVSVVLQEGPPNERISWKLDFRTTDVKTGDYIYHESKGVQCAEYLLKLKIWRHKKLGTLEIWRGSYSRLQLAERIEK